MNKKSFIVFFSLLCLALGAISISAEEAAVPAVPAEPAKTSGLVENLTSKLSLKPEQALSAAGSIFALAKTKLPEADFTKLAAGLPEMDTLLKAAPAAASSTSTDLMSMAASAGPVAGLLGQFYKLGIPTETAAKIVPEVLSFVKAKQGDEIMGLLSKVVQ